MLLGILSSRRALISSLVARGNSPAMPFPFGKSHKSPADIVKNLKDSMTVLEKHDISDKKAEKVVRSRSAFAPEILMGAVSVSLYFFYPTLTYLCAISI